ncbi:unnamed protein product [Rotaria sp. Silwood1]|nr:unnamed protein product [Rotaria sp. Silwood1]CAF1653609.1 unnamed protein product [Rotaria sp. Silwood1]
MLDYTQEACWSPTLTPSSRIHLSISGQLQSYCDLIYHHELYVEHFTSITTHYQLLLLFFILSYTSYISCNCETDQIISCCTLSKILLSIFEYLYQQHGLTISNIL